MNSEDKEYIENIYSLEISAFRRYISRIKEPLLNRISKIKYNNYLGWNYDITLDCNKNFYIYKKVIEWVKKLLNENNVKYRIKKHYFCYEYGSDDLDISSFRIKFKKKWFSKEYLKYEDIIKI